MSVKSLRKLQVGLESTSGQGTEVAATAFLRFEGGMTDVLEMVYPPEDIGILPGTTRAYIPKTGSEITMEGPATYEQMPVILSCAVAEDTGGVADNAAYIYTYTLGATANTVHTLTVEYGDDQQCEIATFCHVRDFTLSGAGGEAVMLSANWFGRQVNTTTFSTVSTYPIVEEILFSQGRLAIDNSGGTVGTTAVSNTLIGFELQHTTGLQAVYSANALSVPDFGFIKMVQPEVLLNVTFEHNASAVAEKAAWRAKTIRLLQLKFTGSSSGGTTYTTKTFIANMAGTWESFDTIGEQDGNDIVTGVFRARWSTADNLFVTYIIGNQNATALCST